MLYCFAVLGRLPWIDCIFACEQTRCKETGELRCCLERFAVGGLLKRCLLPTKSARPASYFARMLVYACGNLLPVIFVGGWLWAQAQQVKRRLKATGGTATRDCGALVCSFSRYKQAADRVHIHIQLQYASSVSKRAKFPVQLRHSSIPPTHSVASIFNHGTSDHDRSRPPIDALPE